MCYKVTKLQSCEENVTRDGILVKILVPSLFLKNQEKIGVIRKDLITKVLREITKAKIRRMKIHQTNGNAKTDA